MRPILGRGRLAQLVRALPSHGRGRGFESRGAHHCEFREEVCCTVDGLKQVKLASGILKIGS